MYYELFFLLFRRGERLIAAAGIVAPVNPCSSRSFYVYILYIYYLNTLSWCYCSHKLIHLNLELGVPKKKEKERVKRVRKKKSACLAGCFGAEN